MKLEEIKRIGPKTLSLFNKIKIKDTDDLIHYYPFRYNVIKRTNLKMADNNSYVVVDGRIETKPSFYRIKKNLDKLSFKLNTGSFLVNVTLFNRGFMRLMLKETTTVTITGKYDKLHNSIVGTDIRLGLIGNKIIIEPVYHLTYGLSKKVLKKYIDVALSDYDVKEYVPEYLKEKYHFMDKKRAIYILHNPSDVDELKEALEKLKLNDAALVFEPETSKALGFGFRTGFLGLLHMDVIEERIEREFKIQLIATAPSVEYHVYLTNGSMLKIDNPSELPDQTLIDHIEEPYVHANLMLPKEYVGPIMEICQNKRGTFVTMSYIDENRVSLIYDLPLSEIVYDFFDRVKSTSRGYASLDYELADYRKSDLVKMDILLNGEKVDALSVIIHRDFAYRRGRQLVQKLRGLIPRQLFEVPVQAAINTKIIARENIAALRKDVLAKCYGGDISRKRKLLEKQKEGKKRMKQVGSVEVPQEAFLAILELDDD